MHRANARRKFPYHPQSPKVAESTKDIPGHEKDHNLAVKNGSSDCPTDCPTEHQNKKKGKGRKRPRSPSFNEHFIESQKKPKLREGNEKAAYYNNSRPSRGRFQRHQPTSGRNPLSSGRPPPWHDGPTSSSHPAPQYDDPSSSRHAIPWRDPTSSRRPPPWHDGPTSSSHPAPQYDDPSSSRHAIPWRDPSSSRQPPPWHDGPTSSKHQSDGLASNRYPLPEYDYPVADPTSCPTSSRHPPLQYCGPTSNRHLPPQQRGTKRPGPTGKKQHMRVECPDSEGGRNGGEKSLRLGKHCRSTDELWQSDSKHRRGPTLPFHSPRGHQNTKNRPYQRYTRSSHKGNGTDWHHGAYRSSFQNVRHHFPHEEQKTGQIGRLWQEQRASTRSAHPTREREPPPEMDHSWHKNMHGLSRNDILSLSESPPDKIVRKLHAGIKNFQHTLQGKSTLQGPGMIDAIITILCGVVKNTQEFPDDARAYQILGEVLSDRCSAFHFQLKQHITLEFGKSRASDSTKLPVERLSSICDLFCGMLKAIPTSAWSVLPVDEIEGIVEQWQSRCCSSQTTMCLDKLHEVTQSLLVLRGDARDQSRWKKDKTSNGQEWDNSEYRQIQVLPQWGDVFDTHPLPRLRENIVRGSYTDWLHYYDIQFRLLREDFIAPLRKGVKGYLEGLRGRKLQNIRVYNKVYIKETFLDFGTCYELKLDVTRMRCNWEHSDRLKYGTLLLLSPDDFKEIVYFATVSKRETRRSTEAEPESKCGGPQFSSGNEATSCDKAKRSVAGKLELKLRVQFPNEIESTILPFSCTKTPFTMIESCAYFEASRHILRGLQLAEVYSMPFTDYLIKGQCGSVEQPLYLYGTFSKSNFLDSRYFRKVGHRASLKLKAKSDNHEASKCDESDSTLNLEPNPSASLEHTECHEGSPNPNLPVVLPFDEESSGTNSEEACSTPDALIISIDLDKILRRKGSSDKRSYNDLINLDSSQLKALQMALTQEVALIQGPPGTGKTYIGLKIVEMLLTNRPLSPILVLCFTNHALDQFLEGILDCSYYKGRSPNEIGLIRVGSRSQSERLSQFNMKERKKKVYLPLHAKRANGRAIKNLKRKEEFLMERLKSYFQAKRQYLLPLRELANFMEINPSHYSSLCQNLYTQEQCENALQIWLQISAVPHLVLLPVPRFASAGKDGSSTRSSSAEISSSNGEGSARTVSVNTKHVATPGCEVQLLDDWCARMEFGFSVEPMTEEEASNVEDIHALNFEDRWRLYMYWRGLYLNRIISECEGDFAEYRELCAEKDQARKMADRYALESAQIIGMTTTGAARYQQVLKLVKPGIVIVEEAAEVLESHIVSALSAGTQHLILIGDHKQLRPKPNEYKLAVKYGLDISLFERLIKNSFPHATLNIQHRMRPEIAQLIKPHIYKELNNDSSVEQYPDVRGVSTNLFFIQHEQEEEEDNSLVSHSNLHEAEYLISLCRYLLQQCYDPKQITILVTYTGQLLLVKRLLRNNGVQDVRVSTVDNFQGEENDIILLSLVRSNDNNNVGFLKEENRVCVTLSRARHGLYCIGNLKMLRDEVPLWEAIMSDMETMGRIGEGLLLQCNNHPDVTFTAVVPGDFEKHSPNGGCHSQCNFRLKCGHVCDKQCHSTDPQHVEYVCKKRCTKKCPEGHRCCKPCFEACKVKVTRNMPMCGHEQEMFCYQKPEDVDCTNPCKKKCTRDLHACPLQCYQECRPCAVKSSIIMPDCLHEQMIKCHVDPASYLCLADCSHRCKSGHKCPRRCHQTCGLCLVQVKKIFPECNHEVSLPCHVTPQRSDCPKPCESVLPCEHACALRCGVDCSSQVCEMEVTVELLSCKHQFKGPCHLAREPSSITCRENCEKTLPCGHPCSKKCGELCDDKCLRPVEKQYPCGHKMNVPCSADHPCKFICPHILACGHKCAGECSDCSSRRVHKPCHFQIKTKRFCGHDAIVSCAGLFENHPCSKSLSVHCTHGTQDRKCSGGSYELTCNEACTWWCQHYYCDKRCSEICSRPVCDERCPAKLRCGHRCYGLCGEPCLSFCPECQSKSFNGKLKVADRFNKKMRYFELFCGHIFTVEYLDIYTREVPPTSHQLIAPLQCPVKECSRPLSCSFRYGNAMKRTLVHVEAVNREVFTVDKVLHFDIISQTFKILNKEPMEYLILKIVQITELTSSQISDINDLKNFVQHLGDSKMTYQTVSDIRSEFLRLSLKLQCQTARTLSDDAAAAVKPVEDFLNTLLPNNTRISTMDYEHHSKAMKAHADSSAAGAIQDITDEVKNHHLAICDGRWWKCGEGHYYCSPPSLLEESIKLECPKCKGSYQDYIHVPAQEELKAQAAVKAKQRDVTIKPSSQKLTSANPKEREKFKRVIITAPNQSQNTTKVKQKKSWTGTMEISDSKPPFRKPTLSPQSKRFKKDVATSSDSVRHDVKDPVEMSSRDRRSPIQGQIFDRLSPTRGPWDRHSTTRGPQSTEYIHHDDGERLPRRELVYYSGKQNHGYPMAARNRGRRGRRRGTSWRGRGNSGFYG